MKASNLNNIVELSSVTKSYKEVAALSGVSLRVEPGVTGLLGPNGSGKSTLIKSLLGLVRTQQGSGSVLGMEWPQRVREIRDQVGYLPEDDCYIAGLNGIESVAFMAHLAGLPGTEGLRRAHEICDFCDIGEERYRPVESYSTGMRQKLKFAQALVHDPPFLILDEPTTGLDPDQREAMLRRIRTLYRTHGKSILLSTHILPDVRSVCDQVIMLVGGEVRIIDTLENLSRPAEPTVHIAIYGDSAPLAGRLREDGFSVTEDSDGSLRIAGIDTDQIPGLWQKAAETGACVRRLTPAMNSLDEIFFHAASETELR
ncbi:MAG: ABC transporter ATP-binding protein [Rubripirellula sp.]|nr:ABC transporter ATP-binding protein [Rubripirellula sp.]